MKTLPEEVINVVNKYCEAYNERLDYVSNLFDFVADARLRDELVVAYRSARYIYKLGQGLACTGTELHAHTKFQITQYASIYEAVIGYMIENTYKEHASVKGMLNEIVYVPSDYSKNIKFYDKEGAELKLCRVKSETKSQVRFDNKVDVCVEIGFMHVSIASDIKRFYKLRNGIHLSNAIKNIITYDIEQAQLAYRRIRPFILGIKGFMRDGKLPTASMTKDALAELKAARRATR